MSHSWIILLLAVVANSAVQSSTRTFFHIATYSQTPPTMHNTSHLIFYLGRHIWRKLLVMEEDLNHKK